MPDLMTQIDGQLVPLAECGWLMRKPCGCIVAALTVEQGRGNGLIATAEQAHKHLRRDKRSRDKDTRDGMRLELITMAHYRTNIGANWECDEHKPEAPYGIPAEEAQP